MTNETTKTLKRRIEDLEQQLADAQAREKYYKEISRQAGRKRLIETRELSQLVFKYRQAQDELAANSEKLEELVQQRTRELEDTNRQLLQIIREQKQTQDKLERSIELDRVILEISSEFINRPAPKIDQDIIKTLEKIGRYADANRVSLYMIAGQSGTMLNTHDWKKSAIENHTDDFHDGYFPTYLEELQQKKDIIITNTDDLTKLTSQAVPDARKNDFHALLAVPLVKRSEIYGALFLYGSRGQTKNWSSELLTFVKIISDVMVNALERKVSELAIRESEERYRDLVEKAGLAIALDAEDRSFHYFNKRFADLFGYTEAEISHLRMDSLIHPADRERVIHIHDKRFQNQKAPRRYEFRGIRKNGDTIYLEVDVVAVKMKNHLIATRSYIWDVSHRVKAAQAIRASEERYRNLVENFMDIVVISEYSGDVLYANPAFFNQTGYTIAELNQVEERLGLVPNQSDKVYSWIADFIKSDKNVSSTIKNQFLAKNGSTLYHSLIISKITYNDKPALQFVAHNITKQKEAEDALKKSAAFERTLSAVMSHFVGSEITDNSIQNALQAIAEWSQAGRATIYRILDSGAFLSSLYEWCDADVSSQIKKRQNIPIDFLGEWDVIINEHGFIHVPDTKKISAGLAQEKILVASGDIQSFLFFPFKVRDNMYGAISLEDTKMTERWTGEDIKLLRLSSEIISNAFERIEAEKMLRRSEEQYRTLFDSSNDEIYVHGFTDQMVPSNFINVNKAACERLGYSKDELLSMNVLDIDAKDEHKKITTTSKRIIQQDHHIFETVHVTKDGYHYPVEVSSHLIHIEGKPVVLSIARNVAERKRMEEEVQKSQRLESIGVLAGGIAHDFNNLLSIILGNAQLARVMGAQGKDITKFLTNIEEGAGQAGTLTRQLLTFSKGGAPIREIYPLPDLIRGAVQLALSGLDEHAEFDFSPDLYSAKVDKGQISQVIHNIILNSHQAMPNGGVIHVSAKNVHSDAVKALQRQHPGDYVRIRIKDHGIGIEESHRKKIFDPYYTTKANGNGLGLTVAYSIVRKHDGVLLLESTPGEGTTVDIYLPAIHTKQHKITSNTSQSDHFNGVAFVMDDEKLVLDVVEEMLIELGFQVKRSLDGAELVTNYKAAMQQGMTPDIVIMDLTVPAGMGGMQAIEKLRKLDPNVKAIVSSGYSNDKIMSHYQQFGFSGIIAKPYSLDDLRRSIATALQTPSVKPAV